jgi:hypothetical protein
MQTYDKLPKTIYRPKRARLSWLAFLTIVLIGVAVIAVMANDVTGAVAKIEPAKPDGTAAYPYADVNQCPPNTDIVIWPEEWHSIPNIPSVFSVCFVAAKNNDGGGLEVRGR